MAEVEGGGFAFDAGADGHDDFACALLADAADEGLDIELFGADAVHGGDEAAEDVVFAAIFAGFFEGDDVAGVGDDADGCVVAVGGATDVADGVGGEVEADAALAHFLFGVDQGFGEGFDFGFGAAEDVEGEALGGFWADAGQALELFDEAGEGRGVDGSRVQERAAFLIIAGFAAALTMETTHSAFRFCHDSSLTPKASYCFC